MTKKQRVAWALCMVGQMMGAVRWIRSHLRPGNRKIRTGTVLLDVEDKLEELREAIIEEYME